MTTGPTKWRSPSSARGLYYTMVNTHLTADEAAYIVVDCGAHTLITSSALAPLAEELVARTPDIELRLMIGGTVSPAHTSYDEFVAGSPGEPLASEVEGSPMLYSSGTTGHPKGIRRPLTDLPFGSGRHACPACSEGIMGFVPGDVVSQPGTAVPLGPAGVVDDGPAHGRHRRA